MPRKKTARSRAGFTTADVKLWAEHFIAGGGRSMMQAVYDTGWQGSKGAARVRGHRLHKLAQEQGLIQQRLEKVLGAMKVDELLQRLSDQARGQDIASRGLLEIAEKSNMDDFMPEVVEIEPGKEGQEAIVRRSVQLDLAEAKKKGLLKFVHALRPTQHGTAVELESRPDALKAVAGIQKSALDTLVKIHGLGEQAPPEKPSLSALAALLRLIPKPVLAEMHRAEARRLQGGAIDIQAREVS